MAHVPRRSESQSYRHPSHARWCHLNGTLLPQLLRDVSLRECAAVSRSSEMKSAGQNCGLLALQLRSRRPWVHRLCRLSATELPSLHSPVQSVLRVLHLKPQFSTATCRLCLCPSSPLCLCPAFRLCHLCFDEQRCLASRWPWSKNIRSLHASSPSICCTGGQGLG